MVLLQAALAEKGISEPTEIQAAAVPALLQHRAADFLLASHTGSGKTLAYLLPLGELLWCGACAGAVLVWCLCLCLYGESARVCECYLVEGGGRWITGHHACPAPVPTPAYPRLLLLLLLAPLPPPPPLPQSSF